MTTAELVVDEPKVPVKDQQASESPASEAAKPHTVMMPPPAVKTPPPPQINDEDTTTYPQLNQHAKSRAAFNSAYNGGEESQDVPPTPPLSLLQQKSQSQSSLFEPAPSFVPQMSKSMSHLQQYEQQDAYSQQHRPQYQQSFNPYANNNNNNNNGQMPDVVPQQYDQEPEDDNGPKTTLWMGDLDPWMDETFVKSTWIQFGEHVNVKMIRDKFSGEFAGVEFSIFVGDIGPEVTDSMLLFTFQQHYPSCRTAKVVSDAVTGLSRGYGFVRFTDEHEQQRSMVEMQGQLCGARPMRISAATPKNRFSNMPAWIPPNGQQPSSNVPMWQQQQQMQSMPLIDQNNTTVFVGGLTNGYVSEDDLAAVFAPFGPITYIKIPPGKGCGFVSFVHRQSAEQAIGHLNGALIGANRIRLSWGRNNATVVSGGAITHGCLPVYANVRPHVYQQLQQQHQQLYPQMQQQQFVMPPQQQQPPPPPPYQQLHWNRSNGNSPISFNTTPDRNNNQSAVVSGNASANGSAASSANASPGQQQQQANGGHQGYDSVSAPATPSPYHNQQSQFYQRGSQLNGNGQSPTAMTQSTDDSNLRLNFNGWKTDDLFEPIARPSTSFANPYPSTRAASIFGAAMSAPTSPELVRKPAPLLFGGVQQDVNQDKPANMTRSATGAAKDSFASDIWK